MNNAIWPTFRVITTDGFILDNAHTKTAALSAAEHRARSMGETMIIQRWHTDLGWIESARIDNNAETREAFIARVGERDARDIFGL